ncbi:MAG: alpha-L-fucosidase [Lentisphaeria bacterium]|nr:alpha-L-fucosidase [Lentisphaeria bacterium]
MKRVSYGLFYDNHTHQENPDVGKDFDAEFFTNEIKKCGVNYLGFHARCNAGMAYYNTKIGTRHPALTYDLFGKLAECCKKKEIALVAYLNGGLSTMELLEHREWQSQIMEGHGCRGTVNPFAITVCYNSGFRDHIIAMIKEIAENYDVEGFFIDCVLPYPCVCPTCVKMMKEQGIDYTNFDAVTEFSRKSALSYCEDIAKAVREIIPDPMLFFNGPVYGTARDLDTFFDCECLPTAGYGYEFLPIMAHYMRNIKPGTQILNMTGRFYEWGDFGGLRTAESLKFDLIYGLAYGMRPNVGGHIHPRGDKDQAVFDRIREVYQYLQKFDEWYENAAYPADIAIVYPEDFLELRYLPATNSAVRMLEELKMPFDILLADCDTSWEKYQLLILPEQVKITSCLAERIRAHIAKGGAFFACGSAAAQEFGKELGIEYSGECGLNPVYFRMNGEFDRGLDDMYLSLYANASKAVLTTAKSASRLVKPYYNQEWNGLYAIYYTPPQEETEMPFLTVNGKCIWCAGDLFTGYAKRGALHLRDIFRNVVETLIEKPFIKVGKLPSFVRLIAAEQPGRLNLHLVAYAPEKRVETTVVEDPAAVLNGSFQVRTAGRTLKQAYLAPDRTPVEFKTDGDYTEIKLPPFEGYALVVLE